MPETYTVLLVEKVYYTVTVEASNYIEAGDRASEMWANSDDPTKDFDGQGEGVLVVRADKAQTGGSDA